MTSNCVPGLRLEFARFLGEAGHFKHNFSIENSNFSQFFVSDIHMHTFSHNFARKNFSFRRHFNHPAWNSHSFALDARKIAHRHFFKVLPHVPCTFKSPIDPFFKTKTKTLILSSSTAPKLIATSFQWTFKKFSKQLVM